MGRWLTEHYYTSKGRQRAVFFVPGVERARFSVEVPEGDEAVVEVSYAAVGDIRKGQGAWEAFDGGLGGEVWGATALRVNIRKVDGWVKLVLEQEKHDG